eukprot:59482-Prymnesium_polylepis.1
MHNPTWPEGRTNLSRPRVCVAVVTYRSFPATNSQHGVSHHYSKTCARVGEYAIKQWYCWLVANRPPRPPTLNKVDGGGPGGGGRRRRWQGMRQGETIHQLSSRCA